MAVFGEQLTLFRSGVAQTSKDAYKAIANDGNLSTMKARVFGVIRGHRGLSRAEVASVARMRLSSVCGRVNELLQAGQVIEGATKEDKTTGKHVKTLIAVEGSWPR